jgi:hypothetical protein
MPFIVVFDDGDTVCCPVGLDSKCDGALVATNGPVAMFEKRADARQAIKTSYLFAQLQRVKGEIYNDDFIALRKYIKIRPLVSLKRGSDD